MKKQISAWALSLSLAITAAFGTASPARANEDVLKVLLGVGALVALGAAVNKQKHKREAAQATRSQVQPHGKVHRQKRVVRKVAPQRCLRTQWTYRGDRQVYGARCMERFAQANLPNRCRRQADVREGPRQFYSPRCLRKQGWRA